MTLISIVVPIFNEGKFIRSHLRTILKNAEMENVSLQLIAVDDGSCDNTAAEIEQAAKEDPRISSIMFTRNFGKEAAILAGLLESKGEAVIVIDADLQHPPELIPKMISLWQQGFPIVEAVKLKRGKEDVMSWLCAKVFYWLFHYLVGVNLNGQCDYKLLDRSAVNAYVALPEKHRFFRGLIDWLGYPSARLPFEVLPRKDHNGRWSKIKLIKYAINNLTSFSTLPLRIVTWLGLLTLILSICGGISLIHKWQDEGLNGFPTVDLLIIITGSVMMISLGIIGHYLTHIYHELKARPPYVRLPSREPPPPDI